MDEESVDLRKERAESSTSAAELEKLAEDENVYVREEVAVNINTPFSLLEKLAEDKIEIVHWAVAGNANTPVPLLEKLAVDEDEDVRRGVAGNMSASIAVLEALAKDKEAWVRRTVAGNVNTPVSLLEKLAEDKDEGEKFPLLNMNVRSFVAGNENTPVSLLEKLAGDKNKDVRIGVAENTSTPVPLLEKLAEDKDEDVRKAVATNANTPASVLEKKVGEDDKVTALQLASMKKTVEKINNWVSKAGKPIRCSSDYNVWANEEEVGTFTVKKDKIEGYMMWENESSVALIWELPGSANAAVETLGKNEWSNDKIEYDEQEGFEDSEGKASKAFDDKGNTIGNYDDFEGGGSTDIVSFGSSYGPSAITITYENDKKIVFEFSSHPNWTVKIQDGEPVAVGDDEAVLVLVRKLLK